MKLLISSLAGLVTMLLVFSVYWVGGGEFVRGQHLGATLAYAYLMSAAAGAFVWLVILPEKF